VHGLLLAGFGASAALYSLIFRHVYTPNVENYFHFCAGIVLSSHAEWYPCRGVGWSVCIGASASVAKGPLCSVVSAGSAST
jgi:hypothetical protein